MPFTSEHFLALVERANLAPSVHNTQPTRWRLEADGSVLVFEETARRLPIADPAGRDAAVSHGSAIEGFAIACAAIGFLVDVEVLEGTPVAGLRPVARLRVRSGATVDPLAVFVDTRRSYRGAFAKRPSSTDLQALAVHGDVTIVDAREDIARLAALNDEGALHTYRDEAYRRELVSWLRLSRRDPRWPVDGLNAEAMAMSPVTAAGARVILAPRVFEMLDAAGIGPSLVSEAAAVRSSEAVALFHRPIDEDPLQTGRRFYRLWLEFEKLGLSAAPMSVLADDDSIRSTIAREFEISSERRLINAFRLGVPPRQTTALKARLPTTQLVMQST